VIFRNSTEMFPDSLEPTTNTTAALFDTLVKTTVWDRVIDLGPAWGNVTRKTSVKDRKPRFMYSFFSVDADGNAICQGFGMNAFNITGFEVFASGGHSIVDWRVGGSVSIGPLHVGLSAGLRGFGFHVGWTQGRVTTDWSVTVGGAPILAGGITTGIIALAKAPKTAALAAVAIVKAPLLVVLEYHC